jgi:hypothetical protein
MLINEHGKSLVKLLAALVAPIAIPATSTPVASPTSGTSPTPTFSPGSGLIHGKGAATSVLSVQTGDGGLGLLVRLHLHETKSFGATRVAIHDDLG